MKLNLLVIRSQKTIIELKKQIVDLSDIKKRHQVVQNELADHMDNANEGLNTVTLMI